MGLSPPPQPPEHRAPSINAEAMTRQSSVSVWRRSGVDPWSVRGRNTKMNVDARFSFPDRRHSLHSEVYPGVGVERRVDLAGSIQISSVCCLKRVKQSIQS